MISHINTFPKNSDWILGNTVGWMCGYVGGGVINFFLSCFGLNELCTPDMPDLQFWRWGATAAT